MRLLIASLALSLTIALPTSAGATIFGSYLVRGDTAGAIGQTNLRIYDNRHTIGPGGRFYMLQPGDKLTLNTREPWRNIEGLLRQPWPRP